MRIVIDLQGAQTSSRFRGIGKYSLSLCKQLLRQSRDHDIHIVLGSFYHSTIRTIRDELAGLIARRKIHIWEAPYPVAYFAPENTWRHDVACDLYKAFLRSLDPDFVLITTMFEGFEEHCIINSIFDDPSIKTAIISYDFIPLAYPDKYLDNPRKKDYYLKRLEQLRQADLVFSISESSRQEAIELAGIDKDRVFNISAALESSIGPRDIEWRKSQTAAHFSIHKPFVLYTSATDWRKNQQTLIEAFSKLPKYIVDSHHLVLSGRLPKVTDLEFHRLAKKFGLPDNTLLTTGHVSDDEIIDLYNLCEVFVFPSIHEGFGLPVLEAMSCGKPVVGSNTSSIPELLQNNDVLFDPQDSDDIARKLGKVLRDDELKQALGRSNLEKARDFSWSRSANLALDLMEDKYSGGSRPQNHHSGEEIARSLASVIDSYRRTVTEEALIAVAHCIARNHPSAWEKQLFIDISELHHNDARTGIQRVVRSITNQFLCAPPENFLVKPVYADSHGRYRYSQWGADGNPSAGSMDESLQALDLQAGDIFLGLDLVSGIAPKTKNFYQYLRDHGVSVYFVVYDLLPLTLPHYFAGADLVHSDWVKVVAQSDGAICISKAVAEELKQWIGENSVPVSSTFSIGHFHLGSDIHNSLPSRGFPTGASVVLDSMRNIPSFLMVGTIEPRKGHEQVLAAFENLWKERVQASLVIIGKKGWKTDSLCERIRSHEMFNKQLFWFEGISDEFLQQVYEKSSCLICASEGEGFGLPLIEAAQHSLPIFARDIPVFREVAGGHAFFFSSTDAKGLANEINEWLRLHSENRHPKSDALPALTWEESKQQLWNEISSKTRLAK